MLNGTPWWRNSPATAWITIGTLVLLLGIGSLTAPARSIEVHNVLHHLNFLPLMIAGILFGKRGAAIAMGLCALVEAPVIAHHWLSWPLDAKDQLLELVIFSAAALIAGYLSDRERAQRTRLERTQKELERVYHDLSESVTSMRKAERLSAAGQLAASLAHEIRNPLASISGAAGILRRGSASPEYIDDCLNIIDKESQRLNKLLTGFLNFAKPRLPRLQPTDPNAILAAAASLAQPVADAGRVELRQQAPLSCPEIPCDPEQLKQVLLNLLLNAIEASPAGGVVSLRTIHSSGRLAIEIEDEGSGIAAPHLEHIFDPFFTTKPRGTGLGLAISSMIVSQHGGALTCRTNPTRGATFKVELELKEHGPETARVAARTGHA